MKKFFWWFMKLFKSGHEHDPKEGEGRYTVPLPNKATFRQVKFEVHGMDNFSESEKEKFNKALGIGTLVLNSKEFKETYSQRCHTVELSNARLKAHGLSRFTLIGLLKVKSETILAAISHNLSICVSKIIREATA